MRLPSTLNAALRTMSSVSAEKATCAPVIASHIRAVLSADAVTMRLPSTLNAALKTWSSCPRRKGGLSARAHVPYSRRSVFGGGDNAFAIGTERGTVDCAVVSAKDYDLACSMRIPDPCCFVPRCGDDALSVHC